MVGIGELSPWGSPLASDRWSSHERGKRSRGSAETSSGWSRGRGTRQRLLLSRAGPRDVSPRPRQPHLVRRGASGAVVHALLPSSLPRISHESLPCRRARTPKRAQSLAETYRLCHLGAFIVPLVTLQAAFCQVMCPQEPRSSIQARRVIIREGRCRPSTGHIALDPHDIEKRSRFCAPRGYGHAFGHQQMGDARVGRRGCEGRTISCRGSPEGTMRPRTSPRGYVRSIPYQECKRPPSSAVHPRWSMTFPTRTPSLFPADLLPVIQWLRSKTTRGLSGR